MTILYLYAALTAAVALRLGWHMAFRLDRYDWRYGNVWFDFWMMVVLWPLLLLKPRVFLKTVISPSFQNTVGSIDLVSRERELDRLRKNPPPCGTHIRYHYHPAEGKPGSTLTFPAEAVEALLTNPNSGRSDPDILYWVNRRDASQEVPTDVPAPWYRFQYIAADLIEQGCGVAQCGACGCPSPASGLTKESASMLGHTWHAWRCACGHTLLQVDGTRIHFQTQ